MNIEQKDFEKFLEFASAKDAAWKIKYAVENDLSQIQLTLEEFKALWNLIPQLQELSKYE